ncbi:hypothetical protein [Vibrio owensii]|uniref:hypothetical protein n=1 Tax=Vibrio owensii TaxID=696485 RepID=UPI0018F26ED1|nr:hypothetical protein [Vibrio owensii]
MREKLHQIAEEQGKSIIFADGYDLALLGYITPDDEEWLVSVYDAEKIVNIMVTEGMDEDEAWEYFFYNISGAYVGKGTPCYINC